MARREDVTFGRIGLTGANNSAGVNVLIEDASGNALLASGTSVPNATAGYAKGCLFIDTDVSTGTTGLYVNVEDIIGPTEPEAVTV